MATAFHAEIVTPERVLFSGDADEVSMRTDVGEIAFLAHHTEFVGALDIAVVTVSVLSGEEGGDAAGTATRFAVHGGFVHVANNRLTVLAGVAEAAAEIDVTRARAALDAARERLSREGEPALAEGSEQPGAGAPLTGARLALLASGSAAAAVRRAEARLSAAGESI